MNHYPGLNFGIKEWTIVSEYLKFFKIEDNVDTIALEITKHLNV
jgi:hypothetical protein